MSFNHEKSGSFIQPKWVHDSLKPLKAAHPARFKLHEGHTDKHVCVMYT